MTLPCCYLAPVSHYRAYHRADEVRLDVCGRFTKQTLRNRCWIDSPQGALALTVPVVKESTRGEMRDVRISDHGNWRHQHWVALESSYRQSPFFEYYADDFAPFYTEHRWTFLADFNEELMQLVAGLLDIRKEVKRTAYSPKTPDPSKSFEPPSLTLPNCSAANRQLPLKGEAYFAEAISGFSPFKGELEGVCGAVYYQVFASRHGFLPDLSIVDLLFNLGPEGVLWL